MKQMFPDHLAEAESIASNGLWFYSVPDKQFLTYVPNINICVNDARRTTQEFSPDSVKFNIRQFGAVYEVTVEDNFPSSILLANNLENLVSEYLDVTDDLYVAVLNSITTPIIMGSKKTLQRLLITSDTDTYVLRSVKSFMTKKG